MRLPNTAVALNRHWYSISLCFHLYKIRIYLRNSLSNGKYGRKRSKTL